MDFNWIAGSSIFPASIYILLDHALSVDNDCCNCFTCGYHQVKIVLIVINKGTFFSVQRHYSECRIVAVDRRDRGSHKNKRFRWSFFCLFVCCVQDLKMKIIFVSVTKQLTWNGMWRKFVRIPPSCINMFKNSLAWLALIYGWLYSKLQCRVSEYIDTYRCFPGL